LFSNKIVHGTKWRTLVNWHARPGFGSGEVARVIDLPLWKFLYLIDRGILPDASYRVAGRRFFTVQDVQKIKDILATVPPVVSGKTLACPAIGKESGT
jgi:hypothetical protein